MSATPKTAREWAAQISKELWTRMVGTGHGEPRDVYEEIIAAAMVAARAEAIEEIATLIDAWATTRVAALTDDHVDPAKTIALWVREWVALATKREDGEP